MKTITKPISDHKSCDEIVANCHMLLDEAEIENLPDHPEGERLIRRLQVVLMRLTLRAEREETTLNQLRKLIQGIEGENHHA